MNFKGWLCLCSCIIFHTLAVNGKTSTIRSSHHCRLFFFFNETTQSLQRFSYGASDNVQPWQPSFFLSGVYSREKTPLNYKNYLLLFVLLRTCVVHHCKPCFSCCVDFVITNTRLVAFFLIVISNNSGLI